MFGKIKIDKADSMFSKYMRTKIGSCEYCHRGGALQVHHFYSRDHENVRFDEINCIVLCFHCHRTFHNNPSEQVTFMEKKFSPAELSRLEVRANTYKKKDRRMELIKATELFKGLEGKE